MTPPTITKGEWKPLFYDKTEWVVTTNMETKPHVFILTNTSDMKEQEANARFLAASKAMAEALLIVCACGEPEKASLYDKEGVEGWKWTHPDGREWTCIGDWDEPAPMHPVAHAALLQAGYTE